MTADEMLESLAKLKAQREYDPSPLIGQDTSEDIPPITEGPFANVSPTARQLAQEDVDSLSDRAKWESYGSALPSMPGVGPRLIERPEMVPSPQWGVEQPESTGTPLAAPPLGSEPVPPPTPRPPANLAPGGQPGASAAPPVPTSQPLVAPGAPEAPAAESGLEAFKRDPNEILREAYKPAIDMALEARKKDLERGTGFGANALGWALMAKANPELQAAGAGIIKRAQTEPINIDTLQSAGVAAQSVAAAQMASQKLDPKSPYAEGQRIAILASPEVNRWASQQAAMTGQDVKTVKTQFYRQLQGFAPLAMDKYMEVLKASGDWSKQRAEEALAYAQEAANRATARSLNNETSQKEKIYAAMNDPNSAATTLGKEALLRSYGESIKDRFTKPWSQVTLTDIAAYDANLAAHALDVIRFQVDREREAATERFIDNKWEMKEAGSGKATGLGGYGQVGNPVKASPEARKELSQDVQAATLGTDYGMRALAILENHSLKGAVRVKFDTSIGGELKFIIGKLAGYQERLSADTRKSLADAQTALTGGEVTLTNTWLGATTAVLRKALSELQSNAYARLAGMGAKPTEAYVNPTMTTPPPTPPVGFRFQEMPDQPVKDKKGKEWIVHTYRYFDVGPWKWVDYAYDPETGTWSVKPGDK